jgi:D-alanyl-D-alanine carboxypeptidase/D-alanyl-D-alanine-endopeptidase (penicillin-binding protein 4)
LFKLVGSASGAQGSWQSGQREIKHFLDKMDGSTDGFVVDDGSGLSRQNLLSTDLIVSVLRYMYNSDNRDPFMFSLATGQVGTLKKSGRFREKIYKGKVFAKTGYISGVWALGGYCQNSAGKWLAFSMLVNKGVSPRKTMDDIVKVMMQ